MGKSLPGAGTEVPPPPLSPIWRGDAHYIRAIPICRSCAIERKFRAGELAPHPDESTRCQIESCENRSSYLYIDS